MSVGPGAPAGGGPRVDSDLLERSDAELLAASRTGDHDAYGELFRRHAPAATALARRLTGHRSDADDLVSESFTKVLAALKNGNGPTSALRPYLLTAVRRVHVDRAVAAQRVQPTDDMGAYDPGVPFVDPALIGLERSMVAQAYRQLPERWQMVLWHTEVEELSPKDIAPLLGMSPNAVAALALRARAGLREAYLAAHVTTTTSPECERMLPKLAAYVRGSAAARERAAVEKHLPDCADCRAVLAELKDVGGRMRAVVAPLILGVAATGYLADIAALPAIAAPPAVVGAASAGGAIAGSGLVPPPPGGGTAAAGSSASGGGGSAGAGVSGQLAGWLVGAAATVIVAGAVAGAVVLGQNDSRQGSPGAEGSPGAGSAQSAPQNLAGSQTAPPLPGFGPSANTGRASGPPLPPANRGSSTSSTSSPTTVPESVSPTAPVILRPTTRPETTDSSPSPTSGTGTTTPSTTAPPEPRPPAPPTAAPDAPVTTPGPLVIGADGSAGALTITVPAAGDAELAVTITLPAGLGVPLENPPGCVVSATPEATMVTCANVQGSTFQLPVTAQPVAQPTTYQVTTAVSGAPGSNITPSAPLPYEVIVHPTPAPPAEVSFPAELVGSTEGRATPLIVTVPTLADIPLDVRVTFPADLAAVAGELPEGCTLETGAVACTGAQGRALQIPLTAPPVVNSTPFTITTTVSGPNLAAATTITPVTVRASQLAAYTTTGQITSALIGGTFEGPDGSATASDASLTLPTASIRYARLYWAGPVDAGPSMNAMTLTDPGGTPHRVAAQATDELVSTTVSGWNSALVSSADVTDLVRAGITGPGTSSWTGAAEAPFTPDGTGFSGWTLVVVAEDAPTADTQITIADHNEVIPGVPTTYRTSAASGATSVELATWGGARGNWAWVYFDSRVAWGPAESGDVLRVSSPTPGTDLAISPTGRMALGAMVTQRPVG